jgi:hypothetical protein
VSGLGGILDVAIGMSAAYLLLSLVCSGMNELVAWAFGLRAKTLEHGIELLLHDPELKDLAAEVYAHPLVKGLSSEGKPAYLPSRTFALALLDTLSRHAAERAGTPRRHIDTLWGIKAVLSDLPKDSAVRHQLELLRDETVKDVVAYRRRVEEWFDESMRPISGVYKRRAQMISLVVGVALAVATGVDSGLLLDGLMRDDALRQATAATAVEYVKIATAKQRAAQRAAARHEPARDDAGRDDATQAVARIKDIKLPVGLPYLYEHSKSSTHKDVYWILRLLGIVFTGLVVALGAPFWFDLLSKLINLRIAGDPPQTSKEKNG